jgi:nitrite reductase/ring-hydroxylating ferredoxin subunit
LSGVDVPAENGRWCPVAALKGLAEGDVIGVELEGRKIAIYRSDGSIYATDNVCTHAYALLSDGWMDNGIVECPLHGGKFDVRTGEALDGPVYENLVTFPARVSADGIIEIAV